MAPDITKYPILFKEGESTDLDIAYIIYIWCENGTPIYVGYTSQAMSQRIREHRRSRANGKFSNKLKKHKETLSCFLYKICQTFEECKVEEVEAIKLFNTYYKNNPLGCNMTEGGDGVRLCGKYHWMSDETKRKSYLEKTKDKRNKWKPSEEWKKNHSDIMKCRWAEKKRSEVTL
jgi:hypothetical protein